MKDVRFSDEYGNDKGEARICNQGFTFSVSYFIK
jgi:hypothetical protein